MITTQLPIKFRSQSSFYRGGRSMSLSAIRQARMMIAEGRQVGSARSFIKEQQRDMASRRKQYFAWVSAEKAKERAYCQSLSA